MKIYTIGHISPDLDAISSAVEYAEFLKKANSYPEAEIEALRSGEANNETKKLFEKFNVTLPKSIDEINVDPSDRFVLVDHNESSQRHSKVSNEQVLEVLDHHKLNVNFGQPIKVTVEVIGSSSSLIFKQFESRKLKPEQGTAGLMLAALLDDTQGLKSSTTTEYDKKAAKKLAKMIGANIKAFTFELFKLKSEITGLTTLQVVKKDYKVFDFGPKVYIGVIETAEPQKILEQKDVFLEALEDARKSEAADKAFFFVVDVLKGNAKGLYKNSEDKEILEKAFGSKGRSGIIDIGPRTSRKKDIAPAIEKAIRG